MGGAQRFLLNLLSRIKDRYEILVATGSDGGPELHEKLKILNISSVKFDKLKREISPANDLQAVFEIRDFINNFKPDDIFLLSSKAGFIGALATKFSFHSSSTKVIYRIGGWSFNDPWPSWKKKMWIKLEKLSAPWKDIIIVNNKHDLEQAKELGIIPHEKMVLIHNGIDPYKMEFVARDEARVKLFEKLSRTAGNLTAGRHVIFQAETIVGTIANLYPTKGIKFLVEAAEHFKNDNRVIFVVIGDGSERKNLELQVTSYKLQKKFFFLGQLADAHKFLPAFDIFVLPSVKEGFPFALIEAMAAKVPAIATRVGAVPEIIDNGKNGFIVEPANPTALAGKIKELIHNDHLLKEFSIQGHQTVLFNFSEDKMVKEIEGIL